MFELLHRFIISKNTESIANVNLDWATGNSFRKKISTESFKPIGNVNVTVDLWKWDNSNYAGSTFHFINSDWRLISSFLEFGNCADFPTTGGTIAAFVDQSFKTIYGSNFKVFVATTDNAEKCTADELSVDNQGMICVCHTLSLVVKKDLFENGNSFVSTFKSDVIDKIESLRTYLNQQSIESELRYAQESSGVAPNRVYTLKNSQVTRWHSILMMLESYRNVRYPTIRIVHKHYFN